MAYEAVSAAELIKNRGPRKGVVAFRDAVLFWTRPKGMGDDGIYNRRLVRGGHSWSLHAVGRAWDCHVTDKAAGDELANRAVVVADWVGICEVIWQRHRWTKEKGWQPYSGEDPHTGHIHFGFTRAWADNPASHDELVKWVCHFVFGI